MSEVDGATLIARCLKKQGINHLFGVVGFPVGPIAAAAMGPTGNPTTPKRWFMPCCLRLLAIKVAPSTSLMLFLLLDRADADRCRQVRGPKKSPPRDYAFMAGPGKGYPR